MADRLRVPVKTWRNWEQGRVALEPTRRSFLALVADDTTRAFNIIGLEEPADVVAAWKSADGSPCDSAGQEALRGESYD